MLVWLCAHRGARNDAKLSTMSSRLKASGYYEKPRMRTWPQTMVMMIASWMGATPTYLIVKLSYFRQKNPELIKRVILAQNVPPYNDSTFVALPLVPTSI